MPMLEKLKIILGSLKYINDKKPKLWHPSFILWLMPYILMHYGKKKKDLHEMHKFSFSVSFPPMENLRQEYKRQLYAAILTDLAGRKQCHK